MELIESQGSVKIHVPLAMKRRSGRKQIIIPEDMQHLDASSAPTTSYRDALVIAFARAFRWRKLLYDGKYCSIAEMSEALGINRWYMSRIIRLTLIDPAIVESIVSGSAPDGISLERLRKQMPMLCKRITSGTLQSGEVRMSAEWRGFYGVLTESHRSKGVVRRWQSCHSDRSPEAGQGHTPDRRMG
jgi:hypothetical protein